MRRIGGERRVEKAVSGDIRSRAETRLYEVEEEGSMVRSEGRLDRKPWKPWVRPCQIVFGYSDAVTLELETYMICGLTWQQGRLA